MFVDLALEARWWKLVCIWCHASLVLESADLQARPRTNSRTTSSDEKGDSVSSLCCQLLDFKELLDSAETMFKGLCKPVVDVNQGSL